MKTPAFLLFLLIAFAACKKDKSNVVQPNQPTSPTIKFPTDKMNGKYMWLGSAGVGSEPIDDAFIQYPILVINDSTILFSYDTFRYLSFDQDTKEIRYNYPLASTFASADLYFNTVDNSLNFDWGNRYTAGRIFTKYYKSNSSLKSYLPNITGPKTFSGTVYDTFIMRWPNDSLYAIDTTITFTALNDSTIIADKDFLDVYDDTMHYKQTNNKENTIVFQSFHLTINSVSTLTYNYDTKSIIFEQRNVSTGWHRHLKLQ